MQQPIGERVKKLRDEITKLSETDQRYAPRGDYAGVADHIRRIERVQTILDELKSLTDWKKL